MTRLQREWNRSRASYHVVIALKYSRVRWHENSTMCAITARATHTIPWKRGIDGLYLPVKSIIYTIAVGSFETESIRLQALLVGPILIVVDVKNSVIKACTECVAYLLLQTSDAIQCNVYVLEISRYRNTSSFPNNWDGSISHSNKLC